MRPIRILLFTAAVSSALLLWSPSASCQPSVKSLSDTPVYMGMVSLNVSPYLPLPSFSAVPSISVHTSHGAFFPRSGVYTGVSAELPYTLIGVAALSSHTRISIPRQATAGAAVMSARSSESVSDGMTVATLSSTAQRR